MLTSRRGKSIPPPRRSKQEALNIFRNANVSLAKIPMLMNNYYIQFITVAEEDYYNVFLSPLLVHSFCMIQLFNR